MRLGDTLWESRVPWRGKGSRLPVIFFMWVTKPEVSPASQPLEGPLGGSSLGLSQPSALRFLVCRFLGPGPGAGSVAGRGFSLCPPSCCAGVSCQALHVTCGSSRVSSLITESLCP